MANCRSLHAEGGLTWHNALGFDTATADPVSCVAEFIACNWSACGNSAPGLSSPLGVQVTLVTTEPVVTDGLNN
jgi:hypothetical protein